METESSLPVSQNSTTCHYTEHCCMTAAQNWGIFGLTAMITKPELIINDMESQVGLNISEYRSVAMYSVPEEEVFPK